MSGESVLSFFRKPDLSPMEARMDVESDRRLFGYVGSGWMFGIVFASYALTIQIAELIPPPLGPEVDIAKPQPEIRIIIPEAAYHRKTDKPKLTRHTPKPGTPGNHAPKPTAEKPSNNPGNLAANVIGSNTGKAGLTAYDIMAKTVKNMDLDKLSEFGTLTRTGATRLGGRRGKQSMGYNEGYNADGTGGNGIPGVEIPGFEGGPIAGKPKAPENIGKPVEIDQFQNTTTRSTASILAVIRSHSPGLRHIYNSYLKLQPGMAGKITLRFAIAPSGQVVDVGLAGSTTSSPGFDARIVQSVMTWHFDPVKAIGNDIVTVPFNFSE